MHLTLPHNISVRWAGILVELSGLFKITVLFKQGWMYFLPCTEQSREMVLPVVRNTALTLLF